jgi:phosphoribosylaminoimidazole carboxylase PurE protein
MSGTVVSIVMGSASDGEQMAACGAALDRFGIRHETRILSAHRTPDETAEYAAGLEERGIRVVVAGAGMAAHLAGVLAAHTRLPVIGVPLVAGTLQGFDALLSMVQMPGGVPVATVGIGSAGAKNAGFLAARILSLGDPDLRERVEQVVADDRARVLAADREARAGR